MADEDGQGSGGSAVFDYNAVFRDDISEILAKVDSKLASDVVDEMVEAYDMGTLLDIRNKMFENAKKKLLNSVSEPGNKDLDPIFDGSVTHGCLADAQGMVDEWALIARKGKPRVAMDTIDFLSYVSGECPYFPYKNVKKNPKKGKNRRGGRRNSQRNKKQTLIPFTPSNTTRKHDGNESVASDTPYSEMDTCDNDTQYESSDEESSDGAGNDQTNRANTMVSDPPVESQPDTRLPIAIAADTTRPPPALEDNTGVPIPQGNIPDANEPTCPSPPTGSGPPSVPALTTTRPIGHAQNGICGKSDHIQSCEVGAQNTLPSQQQSKPPQLDDPPSLPSSQNRRVSPPITMATQTEWDLWGIPIAPSRSLISPNRPSNSCNCEYNVRLLLDRMRELEKRVDSNADQDKARSNYLRERLARAEEEREKMRATMSVLSKQISANSTMIAERSSKESDVTMYDYGARVYACQTGNAMVSNSSSAGAPPPSSMQLRDDVRYHPTSKKSNQDVRPPANGRNNPTPTPPVCSGNSTGNTMIPQQVPLPQRERGKADRSSDVRGQGQGMVGTAPNPSRSVNSVASAGNIPAAQPSSSRQPDTVSKPPHKNYAVDESWAEDHMSDADLICMSDQAETYENRSQNGGASTMTSTSNNAAYGGATRGSSTNQPRYGPQSAPGNGNSRKGEKRVNDGHLDRPSDERESYAGAASKFNWNTVENKRSKRNSDDGMLLGVKSTPHKEIFVKHLDYTRCSKPADLEGRVKSYCRRKGVFILQARVFEQSDCNRANCRVSLKDEDVEKALSPGFWPEHAVVRFWSANPQNEAANLNEGGNDDIFSI